MSHPVLALCTAAVTAAGCVWYIPAVIDLRAGADRPLSHRLTAAACLAWWAGLGVSALLLAAVASWWVPAAALGSAGWVAVALRIAAGMRRLIERRADAYQWGYLHGMSR